MFAKGHKGYIKAESKIHQQKIWEGWENSLLNDGVSKHRINKMRTMFIVLERGVKKPFNEATREDIEEFINGLNRDKFTRIDGTKYSGDSKSDIKKALKQFYKYFKGEKEFYPKEVSWIRSKISKDEKAEEKPVISVDEVKKLAATFQDINYKILTLLLFDSGFRISEMLSAKKRNISFEQYEEGQKCFWIECTESKTEKRKVPVPLFTEDLQAFFNSVTFSQKNDGDSLFGIDYDNYRMILGRHSKKLLERTITPHALRHSSATYYAKLLEGNMNMLAERYGWTYSSNQLRTYIRRSGAYQRAGVKKVYTNEIMKVKEENELLKEKINEYEKDMKGIHKKVDVVFDKLQKMLEDKKKKSKGGD